MEWILSLFYFLTIVVLLPKLAVFKKLDLSANEIRLVYSLKVLAGFALWAIYFFYYGNNRLSADAFRFFDDATIIYRQLFEAPLIYVKILFGISMSDPEVKTVIDSLNNWYKPYNQGVYNDNQSIIRFNALCMLFSFGYFHVHTVIINLLSTIGLFAIYRVLRNELRLNKYILLVAIIAIPQVLLWSSGVLKESLLVFGLGMFFYGIWNILQNKRYKFKSIVAAMFGLLVLLLVKNYILLCLAPGLLFLAFIRLLPNLKMWKAFAISILICALAVYLLSSIESIGLLEKIVSKQVDFIRLGIMSDSGSYFEIPKLEENLWSFIRAIPQALINANLRPFIWDTSSAFDLFSSLEAVFLSLIIVALFLFGNYKEMFNSPIFYLSVSFYISLLILIGLVTPIAGAIVRYKIPALLFMIPVSLNYIIPRIHEKFNK